MTDQTQPVAGYVARRLPPAVSIQFANYADTLAWCETLVKTGFLASGIKTGAQALAIILTGQELGLPPMKALRMINVIQGKPTLSAELQLALFKARGGRATIVSTAERADVTLTHPNGDVVEQSYTLADARQAGLLGKETWQKYAGVMLRWRAIALGLRVLAPDILGGVYDPDELGAVVSLEGEIIGEPTEPDVAPQNGAATAAPTELEQALAAAESDDELNALGRHIAEDDAMSDQDKRRLIDIGLRRRKELRGTPKSEPT